VFTWCAAELLGENTYRAGGGPLERAHKLSESFITTQHIRIEEEEEVSSGVLAKLMTGVRLA
jgi:hypothetical protein